MNIEQINRKIFAELGREKQLLEYRDIIYQLLGVVIDFANTEGTSLRLSNLEYFNPFCDATMPPMIPPSVSAIIPTVPKTTPTS